MSLLDAISRKRDGRENTEADLRAIAEAAADGSAPDYQLSAWLMAAFLNGLSPRETGRLTRAMAESGERLDLDGLPKPWVDKHSTGGVGDKTTLVILPMLAACGLTVVKMSGKGLGITGGTIDKLGSVPGFRTDLTPEEMKEQAKRIGLALTGQTPRLAPADKALYALRDVTGTVASIPLIASSILSKKIAGGAEMVVLDVKCGSGAFMTDLAEAKKLRTALEEAGAEAGLKIRAYISDMHQPLGRSAGNALEVKEAIRVLKGEKGRFRDLCEHCVGLLLELTGIERSPAEVLDSGEALGKAKEWFRAQGGDLAVFENEDWQKASHIEELKHEGPAGWVSEVSAREVGELVIDLGGGRRTKDDEIDPTVGVECLVEVGDRVETGQVLARIYHDELPEIPPFINIESQPVAKRPVILD